MRGRSTIQISGGMIKRFFCSAGTIDSPEASKWLQCDFDGNPASWRGREFARASVAIMQQHLESPGKQELRHRNHLAVGIPQNRIPYG